MNFKTTYLLFGLLVAMLGVLGVVLYLGPTEKKGAGFLFPAFKNEERKPESITKVVIERKEPAGSDIVFERDADKKWKITSPRALLPESRLVDRLIESITDAQVDEEKNPTNRKDSEVDSPRRIIKLLGDNVDLTLTIGKTTPGEENATTYVLSSGRPKTPVAVLERALAIALEDLNYFRDKHLLGDNSADINSIKLSLGKKDPVEFRREKELWRMVKPPYGDADINDLLSAISGFTVNYTSEKDNDFVKDGVTDLAKYHLDPKKADVLRIELTRGEGKKATTSVLLVGVSEDKKAAKYYAALDEGKAKDVVKIAAKEVEPFVKVLDDPGAKRNKNLVQMDEFQVPDAIDVTNTYGLLEFRKPALSPSWELYRGTSSSPVDENEVRLLIDSIKKKGVVTSFPDPKRKKELGLEKPDAMVRIYAGSLEKPDPKKKGKPAFKKDVKPVTELHFGNREGDSVAVERIWGKDSTIVMVPSSIYDLVRRRPLDYFNKNLPPFNLGSSEEGVTKVELTRDGEVTEIDREKESPGKTAAKWKILKPAALKGRFASDQVVRDILTRLNTLQATEIVVEKADKDKLDKDYGLVKPAYKVVITITKDKKPTTHEYDFGKELPGKGVYAKLGGKDTIYLVSLEVLNILKKEVRDTILFNFKPSDVAAVKFTGWKKIIGSAVSRSMEQKDGKWVMKDPKDFPLDPAKVDSLVNPLSHLQAERFVKSGKGLTLAEDAFQIEITLKDKKVLELTVGGLDGSSYFATSNQLKGDVFLVPKDLFEEARKAPGYFSK